MLLLLLAAPLLGPAGLALPGPKPPGGPEPEPPTETHGRILLPTAATFRPFTPTWGHGLTHYIIRDVRPGAPFTLDPGQGTSSAGSCIASCIIIPDFDIVYYGGSADNGVSSATGTYNNPGPESGNVPNNAESAIVFLRHGPGSLEPAGTPFVLRQGGPPA